jgi:hypothetical protein
MTRHTLHLQHEFGGRQCIGSAVLPEGTRKGSNMRVPIKQIRNVDVKVEEINDKEVVLSRREGTSHFMRLLEQLTYRALEATKKGLDATEQVEKAAERLKRVCLRGAFPEDCQRLATLTAAVQHLLEKGRQDA